MNKIQRRVSGFVAAAACLAMSLSTLVPVASADGVSITDKSKFSTWTILGPNGGDVRAIEIDPKNKDRVYITTLDGQIYVSNNAGASWQLLANFDIQELSLDQLMVDTRDSNVIYASGYRGVKDPGGFFKSSDGGKTWKASKELRNASVRSMTQSDKDPNILLVGALDGVWLSKDSGDSWEKISSTTMPMNVDSLVIDPRNASTFYAGTWWRAYKSTDSGQNWRLIKDGMIDDSDVFAVTIDPRDANHLVASACSGIYDSVNGGERWAKLNGIPSDSRRTYAIVQHPTIPGTIYAATNQGFWMSTNGGKSWMMTTSRDLMVTSIAVSPEAPNRVFIGTSNFGVMISDDGGKNWRQSNTNFTSRFTYSIDADTERSNRLYALTRNVGGSSGGSFFTSDDGGTSWTASRTLDINRVAPFAMLQDRTDPNVIYLGTNVGIFRSPDRGVTWTQFTPPKPAPVRRPVAKRPVAKGRVAAKPKPAPPPDPNAPVIVPALTGNVKVLTFTEDGKNGILAGTDKGLFRTYDIAKGWEQLKLGDGVNNNIFAIHVSPKRPDQIWVGTAASGVLVSNDGGKTWQEAGGAPKDVPVSSINSDPQRPDHIYVGTTQTFFLSRDGGQTWTRRGGNLPLGNYTSILIDPQNTDEIFISSALGSDGGVFYSSDAGMKWKRVDSKDMPLPSRRVWSMVFDPKDPNRIFAGTHSAGVYRIERNTEAAKTDAASGTVTGN